LPFQKLYGSPCEKLREHDFAAQPYHAGLEKNIRERNQNGFLRDEIRIIVATMPLEWELINPMCAMCACGRSKNLEVIIRKRVRAGRNGLRS